MSDADAFWEWAVRIYARPEVSRLCLEIQDSADENVPLLLWAAWRAHEGVAVDEPLAAQAIALADIWAEIAITPLRRLRRRLKSSLTEGDEAVRLPLRESIKASELMAERALMTQLAGLSVSNRAQNQTLAELVLSNLRQMAKSGRAAGENSQLIQLAEALS